MSPAALPEGLPDQRSARRCLPSRGSRGSRVPPCPGTMRREDDPLPVSGRFASRSLPDTGPASCRSWCPLRAHALGAAPRTRQGLWSPGPPVRAWCAETGGAPTVPRCPWDDMPRSQPPVVSWARASLAHRIVACRRRHTVGFGLPVPEAILRTTTLPLAGLHDAACLLARSSSVRPLLGWHVAFTADVLARRSSGGTGTLVRTHWVPTTTFLRFLSVPRLRAYLGASTRLFGAAPCP